MDDFGISEVLERRCVFFKQVINNADKATTAIVDVAAVDIGKTSSRIKARTREGCTCSSNRAIDLCFCNPMNVKHPAAISQNLYGIKKYAAG